ncbi:MAG: acyltransferase [Deltaproteobacteria bacterium]|nr:acyltransferase [Deltaproteobacteria bacterium]
MSERRLKIAGVQIAPRTDLEKSLKKAVSLVELSAERGAKIICLPQLFSLRWFANVIDQKNFERAETEDGPTISSMKKLARRLGVILIAPIFEKDDKGYFNTAFVIGRDGLVIGKYRKVHVPQLPLWEERSYFSPGDMGFPVFTTPYGKLGIQLCWDVFFPEGARILALKGAQIIFAPTASAFFHSHKKWERAICSAAHANGVFIFRVNRVGAEERQEFYGRSFCAGPDGEFVERPCGKSEGIALVTIDLDDISSVRGDWVFLKDRRPSLYKELTKEQG